MISSRFSSTATNELSIPARLHSLFGKYSQRASMRFAPASAIAAIERNGKLVEWPVCTSAARRYYGAMHNSVDDITGWIRQWQDGDDQARDRVFGQLYAELKRLASVVLRSESGHDTMQPTALLNDALMKLLKARAPEAENRGHFARIVARAMRQILVDRARRKLADKRGAGEQPVSFDAERHDVVLTASPEQMVSFDQAMVALAQFDAVGAAVVELRVFAGMTIDETAQALNLHPSAVNREWAHASAWLKSNLFSSVE